MELPTRQQRIDAWLADEAVKAILSNGYGDDYAKKVTLLHEIVKADALTHYVQGLDKWTDYEQRRSKNIPLAERTDGWRAR